jgi:hypothetical protein
VQREPLDVRAAALVHLHHLDRAPPARAPQRSSLTFTQRADALHRRRHARQQHGTVILDRRDLVVLDLAAAPQHPHHPGRHLRRDARDVLVARRLELHEPLESPVPHHVRPIEHQRVKVRVQIERVPEALDELDGADVVGGRVASSRRSRHHVVEGAANVTAPKCTSRASIIPTFSRTLPRIHPDTARTNTRSTTPSSAGSYPSIVRSEYGSDRTHCRIGTAGRT